jgi:hypothetical protein
MPQYSAQVTLVVIAALIDLPVRRRAATWAFHSSQLCRIAS